MLWKQMPGWGKKEVFEHTFQCKAAAHIQIHHMKSFSNVRSPIFLLHCTTIHAAHTVFQSHREVALLGSNPSIDQKLLFCSFRAGTLQANVDRSICSLPGDGGHSLVQNIREA